MKWYREKILKIRFPQSKGQREGDQAHKRIAHFILTGENVLTRNERILKPYFPIDGDKFKIETEISEDYPLDLDGVPLIGYIDFLNLSGFYSTPTGRRVQDSCGAEIVDWKSGDLKYAKKPDTVQMRSYGLAVARKLDLDYTRLSHVQFSRGYKPEARKLTTVAGRVDLERGWESLVPVMRLMKDVAKETDVSKIPINEKSCTAYGGCKHRAECPAGKKQSLIELFGGVNMSILDGVMPGDPKPEVKVQLDIPENFREAIEAIRSVGNGFPTLSGPPARS